MCYEVSDLFKYASVLEKLGDFLGIFTFMLLSYFSFNMLLTYSYCLCNEDDSCYGGLEEGSYGSS